MPRAATSSFSSLVASAVGLCVLFCVRSALAACGYADCKSKALWTCSLHDCTTRTIIDLHGSSLWGTIPAVLGSMKSLTYALELYSNQLTGTLPPSLGSLTVISHYLGLSSNKFTGTVRACVYVRTCMRVRACGHVHVSVHVFAFSWSLMATSCVLLLSVIS